MLAPTPTLRAAHSQLTHREVEVRDLEASALARAEAGPGQRQYEHVGGAGGVPTRDLSWRSSSAVNTESPTSCRRSTWLARRNRPARAAGFAWSSPSSIALFRHERRTLGRSARVFDRIPLCRMTSKAVRISATDGRQPAGAEQRQPVLPDDPLTEIGRSDRKILLTARKPRFGVSGQGDVGALLASRIPRSSSESRRWRSAAARCAALRPPRPRSRVEILKRCPLWSTTRYHIPFLRSLARFAAYSLLTFRAVARAWDVVNRIGRGFGEGQGMPSSGRWPGGASAG